MPVVKYTQGGTTIVAKPKVVGFLLDNFGSYYDLTPTAANALIFSEVEPAMERVQTDGTHLPVWKIDEEGERYYKQTRTFNDCVYRATKMYLESTGMGTLTKGDLDFFEAHPRVNTDGVDRANSLCVVHGLVVPWGLGISRVYVPKLSTLGEQHREFATALGLNPKAMGDNNTSNEEFIEALGVEPDSEQAKMIRETFRFEFVDEPPLRPCIVMLSNWTSNSATKKTKSGGANVSGQWTQTSAGMGHSDFVGPRDALHGDWQIAIELGPLREYAADINRYAVIEDAFTNEELQIAIEARMRLSTWSSIVGGKSINDWEKELKASHTSMNSYTPAQVPAEASRPPINGGNKATNEYPVMQLSGNKCPDCQGPTAFIENFEYCLMCNYVNDYLDDICPFCYGDIENLKCTTDGCGYDEIHWIESSSFRCKAHEVPLFFRLLKQGEEKITDNVYCYACPECLFVNDVRLLEYYTSGQSHDETDMETALESAGSSNAIVLVESIQAEKEPENAGTK